MDEQELNKLLERVKQIIETKLGERADMVLLFGPADPEIPEGAETIEVPINGLSNLSPQDQAGLLVIYLYTLADAGFDFEINLN